MMRPALRHMTQNDPVPLESFLGGTSIEKQRAPHSLQLCSPTLCSIACISFVQFVLRS